MRGTVGIEMLWRQTLQVFHTARLGYDGHVGDGAASLHQGGGGGPQGGGGGDGAWQQDVSRDDWQGVYYCVRRGEVSRVGVAGGDEGVEGVRSGVERLTVAVQDHVVVTVVTAVLLVLGLVLTGLATTD